MIGVMIIAMTIPLLTTTPELGLWGLYNAANYVDNYSNSKRILNNEFYFKKSKLYLKALVSSN